MANVHPSTVARVLNADAQQRVSEEVRDRIITLAKEHGYQPNRLARSLRTKRSYAVGILIPDISNPFFAAMFRGAEDRLAEYDYNVILANTDDDPIREQRGLDMLQARQVDGLLLATARREDPAIERLATRGVPFVLVNRHTEPLPPNAVIPDDYSGAARAVEHLTSLGHRRIAHIAASSAISTGYNRQRGYVDALHRLGLPVDDALVVTGSFREQGGYDAMNSLLSLLDPPTAVFAVNDLAASGALHAIHDHGLRVPHDISVVGFNNLPFVTGMNPSLTTLHVPLRSMGVAAAKQLLAVMARQEVEPIVLPVDLICRESTGPAPTRRSQLE